MRTTQSLLKEVPTLQKRTLLKERSRIIDGYLNIHCGPMGIQVPGPVTPHDHLHKAWILVGAAIQNAMSEIDFQNK